MPVELGVKDRSIDYDKCNGEHRWTDVTGFAGTRDDGIPFIRKQYVCRGCGSMKEAILSGIETKEKYTVWTKVGGQ